MSKRSALTKLGKVGVIAALSTLPEREATVLDLLRVRGGLTVSQVQAVLGHGHPSGARRYLDHLVEAGLVEKARTGGTTTFYITDHGRTVF